MLRASRLDPASDINTLSWLAAFLANSQAFVFGCVDQLVHLFRSVADVEPESCEFLFDLMALAVPSERNQILDERFDERMPAWAAMGTADGQFDVVSSQYFFDIVTVSHDHSPADNADAKRAEFAKPANANTTHVHASVRIDIARQEGS